MPPGARKRRSRGRLDAYTRHGIFEVKTGLRSVDGLRAAVLMVAQELEPDPATRGYLILSDPGISMDRLKREWHEVLRVLQVPLAGRLTLIVFKDGHAEGLPELPSDAVMEEVNEIVAAEESAGTRQRRPDSFFIVLKLLVNRWVTDGEPVTTSWLMEAAGCSYPTVAAALKRLGRAVSRGSDRRVALNRFPTQEWTQLVLAADRLRGTVRFADRSGQPRSPEDLYRRLNQMQRSDIAVGGVLGARHWCPALDLHGTPRLDLSVHRHGGRLDLGFVSKLDPGLIRTEDPQEPALLAVHVVYRADPMFEKRQAHPPCADPVECLLDLHELHLEAQAKEFLEFFVMKRATR